MDQPTLLKIGDFARLADTNLRTLRYYEELGLLLPAERSSGGFRYYRETDINRLTMIRQLQELGMQLDEIGELLTTRNENLPHKQFLAKIAQILKRQDALLSDRIAELEEQRTKVSRALNKLSECSNCESRPGPDNNFCEPCVCSGTPLPKSISALF